MPFPLCSPNNEVFKNIPASEVHPSAPSNAASEAVKAIAKTLSMTMKITQLAYEHNIPCFCADLTVNPILIEWNKNVAARLPAFPGITVGLQEANGHQYYKNWKKMVSYHPQPKAPWVEPDKGVYHTEKPFFEHGGGIFAPMPHYEKLFDI